MTDATAAPGRHRSFWLQEVAGDAPDAPAFAGDARTDVAIIGGGYVGLWTAIGIKRLEPGCDVVVLDQDICGGGASGRNGGFALSWWPKISSLVALCGHADALRVARDSEAAIGEIRDRSATPTGSMRTFARRAGSGPRRRRAQLGAWEGVVSLCERLGVDAFRRLAPEEVARRSGSPVHRAGVFESERRDRPAGDARSRSAARRAGVREFGSSSTRACARCGRNRPVVIRTDRGDPDRRPARDRANAWAASIPELARRIVAITSDMVVTAPAPDALARPAGRAESASRTRR